MSNRDARYAADGTQATRVPPHNLSFEAALIGGISLNSSALEDIQAFLTPGDFYDPWYGIAYAAALGLYRHGQPVDALTIVDAMGVSHGERHAAVSRLIAAQADTPSITNVRKYAERIVDYANHRRLVQIAGDLAESGYDPQSDPTAVADRIRAALAEIARPTLSGPPRDLWDIDEFLAQPDDTAEWVIPGLTRRQMRTIITAPPGWGKTLILRSMSYLTPVGIHPLFPSITNLDPVNTLFVDLENPGYVVRTQYRKLAEFAKTIERRARRMVLHRPEGMDLNKRADRADLEAAIAACNADVVLIGPLYKLALPGPGLNYEQAAMLACAVLDDLRSRRNFALVLEHHLDKNRDNFAGAAAWERWPEIGIRLKPTDPDDLTKPLQVTRYRPDRIPVIWPETIERGMNVWWKGTYPTGEVLPADYIRRAPRHDHEEF